MKTKELRQKNEKELLSLLEKQKSDLLDFKFKLAKGKAKNVKAGQAARKNIAKILTILREKI